jgi:hypothetical protein
MGYIDSLIVQFRSSRSNRHLQHENAPRIRGGVGGPIDHDPTEGLPVKKWQLSEVTIKQVEKDDDGDDAKTGNINPDYPWPELPLPKDFHQLPPHSQVCVPLDPRSERNRSYHRGSAWLPRLSF